MTEFKPTVVDFRPEGDKSMQALTQLLERNADDFARMTAAVARVRRAYFTALVEQGFGVDQALYLCSQGGTPLDFILNPKK